MCRLKPAFQAVGAIPALASRARRQGPWGCDAAGAVAQRDA